jgi:regulatory protein
LKERSTVSVVHAENSSSPNVNITISSIKTGASGESVHIRFSDGSSFFISPENYLDLNIHRDMPVTEELREELQRASEFHAAVHKALQLSARRDHARYEMDLKLRQRGFPDSIINRVLEKLQRIGIIDDRRFAESWLYSRMQRKNEGPHKMKAALLKKGVDTHIVEDVIQSHFTPERIEESLAAATEKAIIRSGGDQGKFIRMLQNRGFSWELIKKDSIDKFIKYYNDLH